MKGDKEEEVEQDERKEQEVVRKRIVYKLRTKKKHKEYKEDKEDKEDRNRKVAERGEKMKRIKRKKMMDMIAWNVDGWKGSIEERRRRGGR